MKNVSPMWVGLWGLLLPLIASAQPRAVECHYTQADLLEDGRCPCMGLPFEVRFPGEKRIEQPGSFGHNLLFGGRTAPAKGTTSSEPAPDAAGFAFAPFQWFFGHTPEVARDKLLTDSLQLVSREPLPEVLERSVEGERVSARFRARIAGADVTGEVRVVLHEGFGVVLLAWGPKGGKYAAGSPAAKAVLESFRAVKPSPSERRDLERGVSVQLPPGTLLSSFGEPAGWRFYTSRPVGSGAVKSLDRYEDTCDGITDVAGAMVGLEFKELESPKLTPIVTARGKGFLVEGADKKSSVPTWVTNYLFCDGKTWPVRAYLETPARSPEAVAYVRELAESVTGPVRRDLELRVAMTGNYWPLHGVTDDACHGLEMSLASSLARALGKKSAVCLSRKDSNGLTPLEAVAKGKVDVALSAITPTEERRRKVDFTEPYVTLQYRLARRSAPEVTQLSELAGKSVAVPAGTGVAELRAALQGATVTGVKSTGEALKLLRAGKVDYVAGEDVGLLELLSEPAEALTGPVLAPSPIAMAVQKGKLPVYAPVMAKLSGELEDLRAHFAPGQVPAEVGFSRCKGEKEPWTTLDVRTFQFREDPPPAHTRFVHALDGEEGLCASVALRPTSDAPPKKLLAEVRQQVKAHAETLKSQPRETMGMSIENGSSAKVDWSGLEKWARRPGLWVSAVPVKVKLTCIVPSGDEADEDRAPCSETRFVAIVIQGEQVATGIVEAQVKVDFL